jgi:hypothetical protein
LVLEETDLSSATKTILWLNKVDGFTVKANVAGRNIYLTDKSVMYRITIANMDNVLFVKVGKLIPDSLNLSLLRIKAEVNSYGENITSTSLNFPGQKFEGSVTNGYINGVFEIKPVSYKGKNAPPFPPKFMESSEIKKYLDPEIAIESDDPQIVSEAKRITSGSIDSWEAAVRLSEWIAENISGAVPGGISAINTLKTREAECSGHSRLLTAFCRAVGIPARLVTGCVYTAKYNGSFGQHAWTEIYMGDAGWIAVDATLHETDFIDAGHIRFGEKSNFQPVSIQILDYR